MIADSSTTSLDPDADLTPSNDSGPNVAGFGGFGYEAQDADAADPDQAGYDSIEELQNFLARGQQSAAAAYGQNAAQRWSGTPAIGLGIFQPRTPLIGGTLKNGRPVYQKKIDASTYFASPPEGLIGGRSLESAFKGGPRSALTPEDQWRGTFAGQQQSKTGAPVTRPLAPIISRVGGANGFSSSYQGGAARPGYAY